MNKINALLWGLAITGVSSLILLFSTIISIKNINPFAFSDKIYHGCAYALFSFVLTGFLKTITQHHLSSIVLEAVALATLFGIALEFTQFFIPNRSADVVDLCANIIGACVGATAFFVVYYFIYC